MGVTGRLELIVGTGWFTELNAPDVDCGGGVRVQSGYETTMNDDKGASGSVKVNVSHEVG